VPWHGGSARSDEPRRRLSPGLIVILSLFLILGVVYSIVTPLFEASDELWHYPLVRHLSTGGGLPVQDPENVGPWRQEGSQPPLYYALMAAATAWIDTSDADDVRWLNPHADMGVPHPDRNVNMVIHTEREQFPYRGTVLAVRVVRWLSVLMGAVTVWAAYALARVVVPGDEVVALATAAITAFNAMYLFVTASVNNDALVIMLCALALWLMAQYLAHPPTPTHWVLLGAIIGLAALTKASALGLLGLAGLLVAYRAWRVGSWRDLFVNGVLVGVPVLLVSGWWFVRNWRLYRDPLGLNTFVAIVGARHPQPTLRQLLGEWRGFVMSYWGLFGGMNVPAPAWVYRVLSAWGLLGLVGAPVYIWRCHRREQLDPTRAAQFALVALWPMVVLAALVRWTLMTIASQGRLMFSALTAISLLMAMGLAAVLPRRGRAVLPVAASVTMLVFAALLPFTTIAPAYARSPILTETDLPPLDGRPEATFGDAIAFLGYTLEQEEALPGQQAAVTLYWKCLRAMDEDHSVFVHLLDANEVMIAQRDMYPGQGTYPTSLWSPGEILADRFVLVLPETALTPNVAVWEVGFYLLESGTRLPVHNAAGEVSGDNVRFGTLRMERRVENGIPNPVRLNFEDGISLIGYDLDRTAARPGEALSLTLYWQARKDIHTNYSVFTQIVGQQHRLWAQMDGWPLGGEAPTATWVAGQIIRDPYELTLAADAPPGVYPLQVGMYDAEGRRLNLLGPGGYVRDNRIVLGHVRVLPRGSDTG